MDDSADHDQNRVASEDAEGRESGIVEVERKAIAVTGGVTGAAASLPTSTNEITGTRESVAKSASRGTVTGSAAGNSVAGSSATGSSAAGSSAAGSSAPGSSATGSRAANGEIEIDTDLPEAGAPRAQMITQTNVITQASQAGSSSAADDDAIPVSDDEIESAEPTRPTLTSGLQAFSPRSRPPARPSLRPRSSSTSLPPPRTMLGSSLPPPSFPSQFPSGRLPSERLPSERDPWILANKTLELSRATARISALEDQIAFRDARILTLEERLESAQQKIAELEAKLELAPAAARPAPKPAASLSSSVSSSSVSSSSVSVSPSASSSAALAKPGTPAKPASVAKQQVSIPKPSDMAKPPSSRQPSSAAISPAAAAVFATGPTPGSSARVEATPVAPPASTSSSANGAASANAAQMQTPVPAEASESVAPPALAAELAASRVPNGPEDLQRIAGIGPRFEAALRKQGITRVSQIAVWSEADIRQVAKALKIPKSRIVKGRWVETARELAK